MADLTRGERLQIMLTEEELKALDDWRFQARMPSRASAVRELLRRGLAAEGFANALSGQKSEDFGVTNGTAAEKRTPRSNGDAAES
jgi:hypothetical protein